MKMARGFNRGVKRKMDKAPPGRLKPADTFRRPCETPLFLVFPPLKRRAIISCHFVTLAANELSKGFSFLPCVSGALKRFFPLVVCAALLTSCRSTSHSQSSSLDPHSPEMNRRAPNLFDVCLETTQGKIVIEVHRDWSPHGADRFYNLVRAGYYDDSAFFRVIKDRWAQFGVNGDPEISKLWRGQTIPDDPRVVSNTRGTIAFAFAVPQGRTTEVFINLKNNSATHDAEPFVPFGKIIEGMDVAGALNTEYGENAGSGIRSGNQGPLFESGNAWLKKNFPRLDYIQRATIEKISTTHLQFDGVPVELKIGEASGKNLRIQLLPLDAQGKVILQKTSGVLVPFSTEEKFAAPQLSGEKEIHAGNFRVTIQPEPFVISIRRADGTLVQELNFSGDETDSISFRTDAPVLGLGEGAEQFDRRGVNYTLVNGERYKLGEFGARILSPFLIGADGWAMFVNAPNGSFDLRGERGAFHQGKSATQGQLDLFVVDSKEPSDAMREFTRLTGAPVMPPKWALGYMQSHRTLSTEADILAEAKTFREKNLPCDALIFLGTGFCPAGWNLGHDSFELNTNVFTDDATTAINKLHDGTFPRCVARRSAGKKISNVARADSACARRKIGHARTSAFIGIVITNYLPTAWTAGGRTKGIGSTFRAGWRGIECITKDRWRAAKRSSVEFAAQRISRHRALWRLDLVGRREFKLANFGGASWGGDKFFVKRFAILGHGHRGILSRWKPRLHRRTLHALV